MQLSQAQIDALAVAFTIFASLWLVLAVMYMATVCLFFRMRSRGELRGSMSDPTWGRAYIFGRRNDEQAFYIPMGWLFRRYVMYQRSGEERARIAKIRVMSVEERRAAIGAILRPGYVEEAKECEPQEDMVASLSVPVGDDHGGDVSGEGQQQDSDRNKAKEPNKIRDCERNNNGTSKDFDCENQIDAPFDEVEEVETKATTQSSEQDDDNISSDVVNDATTEEQLQQRSAALLEQQQQQSSQRSNRSEPSSFGDDENSCPICFMEYTPERPAFASPKCSHSFHWDCLLSWLEFQSHRDCPCCRKELISEEEIWKVVREQRKKDKLQQRALIRNNKQSSQRAVAGSIRRGGTHDEDDEDLSYIEPNEGEEGSSAELVIRVGGSDVEGGLSEEGNEITYEDAVGRLRPLVSGFYQVDLEDTEAIEHVNVSDDSSSSSSSDIGERRPPSQRRPQDIMRRRRSDGPVDLDCSLSVEDDSQAVEAVMFSPASAEENGQDRFRFPSPRQQRQQPSCSNDDNPWREQPLPGPQNEDNNTDNGNPITATTSAEVTTTSGF